MPFSASFELKIVMRILSVRNWEKADSNLEGIVNGLHEPSYWMIARKKVVLHF